MYIRLSFPAGVPLNGLRADGSSFARAMVVLGTLIALSLDSFAKEPPHAAINARLAKPEGNHEKLSLPGWSRWD
jgi:hypothetical protein